MYLHEIDPHKPYDAPEPYGSMYDFGYQSSLTSRDRSLGDEIRMASAINARRR